MNVWSPGGNIHPGWQWQWQCHWQTFQLQDHIEPKIDKYIGSDQDESYQKLVNFTVRSKSTRLTEMVFAVNIFDKDDFVKCPRRGVGQIFFPLMRITLPSAPGRRATICFHVSRCEVIYRARNLVLDCLALLWCVDVVDTIKCTGLSTVQSSPNPLKVSFLSSSPQVPLTWEVTDIQKKETNDA